MHARLLLSVALVLVPAMNAGCVDFLFATEEETRSCAFPHEPGTRLRVVAHNGAITVQAAEGDRILVEARVRARSKERLERVRIECDRDASRTATIRAEFPDGRKFNEGVSYDIRIPASVTLSLETINGRIRVAGDFGPVRARTTNGRIELTGASGPVEAETTNGRIEVHGSRGPVHVRTSNGSVTLSPSEDFQGVLSARTSNGSVRIERNAGWSVRERGRKHATVAIGASEEVSTIRTTNGSVRIR